MVEMERAERRLTLGLAVLAGRAGAPACVGTPEFEVKLLELMRLVLLGNESINLTAICEPQEFVELHLLDSLAPVGLQGITRAERLVDVGTGAGFPGLPLALAYPDKQFVLLDSLAKRITFIQKTVETLGLKNVVAVHARAEDAGRDGDYRESFDIALSRATGPFSPVLEYTLPLIKVGGELYAYKTVAKKKELEDTTLARELLGGAKDVEVFTYRDVLPDRGHAIFIVNKTRSTSKTYPRKAGIPTKIPL
jgi:16S rRNA (guanine527-N7)-methyltransferase